MTIQQLSSYLDAALASDSMERVGIHLSSCEECTGKFVALERQADRLAEALRHDPGDLLSDRFEQAVDERIQNGKRVAAPRPASVRALPPLPPLPPLPKTPPAPIPRAPLSDRASEPAREDQAPMGIGDGAKRAARDVATAALSFTRPRRREGERRRWPVAWAAVVLVVIVAGAGVAAFRAGLLPSGVSLPSFERVSTATGDSPRPSVATAAETPAAAPAQWAVTAGEPGEGEPTAPTGGPGTLAWNATREPEVPTSSELPAGEDAPESPMSEEPTTPGAPEREAVTTTLRGDELLPSGSSGPAPPVRPVLETGGPGATTPAPAPADPRAPSPAEGARQMSERAASDPSAASYEAAARAWEAALGSLHGDAYQDGRWHIAEARYRAWQMEPEDGHRASRANGAIRSYLIAAPPGEEREQARAWLGVIRDSGFRYVESPR